MNVLKKIALFTVLLISGLQLSAKNKERVFIINEYGSDILVKISKSGMTVDAKVIKKGNNSCMAATHLDAIDVSKNAVLFKGIYKSSAQIKADNIIFITKNKKSKDTPSVKVYKNHAAFIAAKPDYQLNGATCPSVLPVA